jgi:sensor domain CHASE-containing protein
MAAQHTRSFGREAAAVYLAAALVVFGTWTASRYLILRKFENIEHNDVARSVEVMRKALVTKNTEIETVSRDFARWDDMYSYVSTLDTNFEYQNFSEAGLDEMNVDLVWLLDPKEKLLSSFENDTDDARYHHPASDDHAESIADADRSPCSIRKARAWCRSMVCRTSIAAPS